MNPNAIGLRGHDRRRYLVERAARLADPGRSKALDEAARRQAAEVLAAVAREGVALRRSA